MTASAKKYSVSVIVPSYNMAHLLPRSIESAAQQEHAPAEIIVVDDGSSDNTVQVLQELSDKYPALRFKSQQNKGNAGAKNTGIEMATGEFLAFLDADDVWLPNRLSSQIELLQQHPSVKWAAGAYLDVTYKNNQPVVCGSPKVEVPVASAGDSIHEALELIASPTSVWIGTIIAETAAIRELGGFCEELLGCDDSDLWLRMALVNSQIGFVVEPVARYTVAQQGSLTGMASRKISPTQFLHYERLSEHIRDLKDTDQKQLVSEILKQKTSAYLRGLTRARAFGEAKRFKDELKKRGLPVPSFWVQVCAFWPPWRRSSSILSS